MIHALKIHDVDGRAGRNDFTHGVAQRQLEDVRP